jgi:hypothetical protein
MPEVTVYQCPGGCPPGECDTKGEGVEGRSPCPWCEGTGTRPREPSGEEDCPRCGGDGLGGGWSSATCSKCGQSAISRAMWECP